MMKRPKASEVEEAKAPVEYAWDEARFGKWEPTHVMGGVEVKKLVGLYSGAHGAPLTSYLDATGKPIIPNINQRKVPVPIHAWLRQTTGKVRLSLEELCICARAVTDPAGQYEIVGCSARHLGGGKVIFSRREEDGGDVRYYLTMPTCLDLEFDAAGGGQEEEA